MALDPNIPLGVRPVNVGQLGAGVMQGMQMGSAFNEMKARREARKQNKIRQEKVSGLQSRMPNNPQERMQWLTQMMPLAPDIAKGQALIWQDEDNKRIAQQKRTRDIVMPYAREFSKYDDNQKAQSFVNWREMLRRQGASIPQHWEGGYTPQVGQEIEMIGSIEPVQRGTKTFEQEKELIKLRGETQADLAQKRSDIKTMADLTAWQKEQKKIARDKANRDWKKLGIDEGEFDIKKEDFEQKSTATKRKELELHKKTKLKNAGVLDEMEQFINLSDELSQTDLSGVTGWGAFRSKFPGKSAATLNKINRLSAMGTIETMAKLKRESPTGSTGFGALSEKELAILENSFAAIKSQKLLPKDLSEELNRISNVMRKYKNRINRFEKKYGTMSPLSVTPKKTKTIKSGRKKPTNLSDSEWKELQELEAEFGN